MEVGEEDDSKQYEGSRPIALMVGDLERAWSASVEATKAAFPAMRARQACCAQQQRLSELFLRVVDRAPADRWPHLKNRSVASSAYARGA